MAHSIELLLDDVADARVRACWRSLEALGVRTPASIESPTVRPHCTLLAGTSITAAGPAMATLAQRLGFRIRLGAPILLPGAAGRTLALSVVPSAELLTVHADAYRLCGGVVDGLDAHCVPGCWTPHVTLARRVPLDAVASAVALFDDSILARASALRRWNGDTSTETVVPGRGC